MEDVDGRNKSGHDGEIRRPLIRHAFTTLATLSHRGERERKNYTGRLSCFRFGTSTCLFFSMASARAMRLRVACGMMTSSI